MYKQWSACRPAQHGPLIWLLEEESEVTTELRDDAEHNGVTLFFNYAIPHPGGPLHLEHFFPVAYQVPAEHELQIQGELSSALIMVRG